MVRIIVPRWLLCKGSQACGLSQLVWFFLRAWFHSFAASTGAPQAIQVADRFHLCQNLADAVQRLLARVLSEMKATSQEAEAETSAQKEASVAMLEWRPDQGVQVARTIAIR